MLVVVNDLSKLLNAFLALPLLIFQLSEFVNNIVCFGFL
jgi:hypothetical protein